MHIRFGRGQFLDLQAEGDIVPDGHMGIQGVALEHHGDVPVSGSHVIHPPVPHVQVTAGNGFQACDHAQGGGLVTAGRPQQDQPFAGFDGKVQVPDHLVGAVDVGNVMKDLTVGFRHGKLPFSPSCHSA